MPAQHEPHADAPQAHDREDAARAARADGERAEATAIHALIAEAEQLYKDADYRRARAMCRRLAALDPAAFMPEQMIEACDRNLRRRRAFVAGLLAALAIAAFAARMAYGRLTRIHAVPAEATARVAEHESCRFAFHSTLGRHRALEYTWTLLAPGGAPAPAAERRCLTQEPNRPWACSYAPSYAVAKAAADGAPTRRTLEVRAVDDGGAEVLARRWTIEVANVPQPPVILAVHPAREWVAEITTDDAARFRVEARDGDGADQLLFLWLLDARPVPGAAGPRWTYRPDPTAIAALEPKLDERGTVVRTVACRVANRYGRALTQSHTWNVLVTPARAAEP